MENRKPEINQKKFFLKNRNENATAQISGNKYFRRNNDGFLNPQNQYIKYRFLVIWRHIQLSALLLL
jgi:hypothetical protein